jgi:TPR repeat protein
LHREIRHWQADRCRMQGEKREADVWLAMKSDAVTVEKERCVACAGLWYDWFSDYFTDSGRPAMFDVALLLREGQPKDDDVLELIRGAVTTKGGRMHTLPIIAQWAKEQQAPEFLTAIGLALETYKAYPDAVLWYTQRCRVWANHRHAKSCRTARQREAGKARHYRVDTMAGKSFSSWGYDRPRRLGISTAEWPARHRRCEVRGSRLLKEAADAGNVQGAYLLGRAYALGEGLPKQVEQARPLLSQSSSRRT